MVPRSSRWSVAGDEPQMLARALPACRFSCRRIATWPAAWPNAAFGCTVHILDDGFQHLQLARDDRRPAGVAGAISTKRSAAGRTAARAPRCGARCRRAARVRGMRLMPAARLERGPAFASAFARGRRRKAIDEGDAAANAVVVAVARMRFFREVPRALWRDWCARWCSAITTGFRVASSRRSRRISRADALDSCHHRRIARSTEKDAVRWRAGLVGTSRSEQSRVRAGGANSPSGCGAGRPVLDHRPRATAGAGEVPASSWPG